MSRKRLASGCIVFAITFVSSLPALAQLSVSINNPGSTALHEVSVDRGGTFVADVNVNSGSAIFSELALRLLASQPGVFQVTSGAMYAPFSGWTYAVMPTGGLDPQSNIFGGMTNTGPAFGPASATLLTMNVAVACSAAIGDYGMSFSSILYRSHVEPELFPGESGPDFLVHVTPEPGAALLGSFGVLLFASKKIRRRAFASK